MDAVFSVLGVVYYGPDAALSAADHLCALKQGHRTVQEFSRCVNVIDLKDSTLHSQNCPGHTMTL